jgi:Lon protease-like protein
VGELIPLFPLATPLFPGIVLPLVIFEPRYRRLVRDLVALPPASPRRFFGVVAIRQGWEVEALAPVEALYDVGCAARLQDVRLQPDGRFGIVTVGAERFRLLDVVVAEEPPYLQAEVAWLPDEAPDPGDGVTGVLRRGVGDLFTEYVAALAGLQGGDAGTEALLHGVADDAQALSYLVASAALLPAEDRQALLAEPATRARLAAESRLLRRELVLLRTLGAVPAPLQQFAVPMTVN